MLQARRVDIPVLVVVEILPRLVMADAPVDTHSLLERLQDILVRMVLLGDKIPQQVDMIPQQVDMAGCTGLSDHTCRLYVYTDTCTNVTQ